MKIGAKINGNQMPDNSDMKDCSNLTDKVTLSSDRPWGSNNATASCSGTLEVESKNLELPVGDVYSEAWIETTLTNTSSKEINYYITLDYSFNLQPGYSLDHYEGGLASGGIELMVNGVLNEKYDYSNTATISRKDDGVGLVNFSGSSKVAEEKTRFLVTVKPNESLSYKCSISAKSFATEYYKSGSSGKLTATVDPIPLPIPPEPPHNIILKL